MVGLNAACFAAVRVWSRTEMPNVPALAATATRTRPGTRIEEHTSRDVEHGYAASIVPGISLTQLGQRQQAGTHGQETRHACAQGSGTLAKSLRLTWRRRRARFLRGVSAIRRAIRCQSIRNTTQWRTRHDLILGLGMAVDRITALDRTSGIKWNFCRSNLHQLRPLIMEPV